MKVEYYKEYSPCLERDMEYKVYGHAGTPILVFPSQNGRFFDFENNGMVATVEDLIDNGNIQLLLKSDNKSYLITTRKIFRSDLAIHFKRKPGAELSGFICEFDKIDAGKYQIYVCCNGKATKTKRHIIINK